MSIDIYSADAFHCQEVPLSMLASVTDSAEHGFYGGVNNYVRYGDFVGLLHASAKHRQFPYKEAAPLFSPTIYNLIPNQIGSDGKPCRGYRNFPNATVARLLVIDADQGLTIGEACQRCEQAGIEAILYTTASNRSGDRFRVVVPLAGTVDVETQKAALRSFCAFLKPGWSPDTSKWNCYSLSLLSGQ